MVEIRTPRLTLRSARPEDADQWRAFVGDPRVARWTASWAHPIDEAFLAKRLGTPYPPERGFYGSICREGEIIGAAALTDGVLGYMLRRDTFGQGYATEVARALIDYGFNTLGLSEVTAGTMDGNRASERVLEKLGFVRTGPAPFPNAFSGRDLPGTGWRLTAREFHG